MDAARDRDDWLLSRASCPVGHLRLSPEELRIRRGPPTVEGIESPEGPFDAWLFRFPCGLSTSVRIHRPEGAGPTGPVNVELHASNPEQGHLLFHLGIKREELLNGEFDVGVDGPRAIRVVRLDDNGNEFLVDSYSSRCEAAAVVERYEARGHRQSYFMFGPAD
ncbi:MAG: hypothetical protein AAGF12_21650 [Myxococcota bacterium]